MARWWRHTLIPSSRLQALRLPSPSASNSISAMDPFRPSSTGQHSPEAAMVAETVTAAAMVTVRVKATVVQAEAAEATQEAGTAVARPEGAQAMAEATATRIALDSCCRSDTDQTQRGSHPHTGSSWHRRERKPSTPSCLEAVLVPTPREDALALIEHVGLTGTWPIGRHWHLARGLHLHEGGAKGIAGMGSLP
jgi:hypothetical protein